jgi:hypothetical protein
MKYYSELNKRTGLLMILAVCLDPFQKLTSFTRWDRLETKNYTQEYRTVFLSYFEANYAPKTDDLESSTQSISPSAFQCSTCVSGEPKLHSCFSNLDDLDVDIDDSPDVSEKGRLCKGAIECAKCYIESSQVHPYPANPEEEPDADPTVSTDFFPSCDIMGFWRER